MPDDDETRRRGRKKLVAALLGAAALVAAVEFYAILKLGRKARPVAESTVHSAGDCPPAPTAQRAAPNAARGGPDMPGCPPSSAQ